MQWDRSRRSGKYGRMESGPPTNDAAPPRRRAKRRDVVLLRLVPPRPLIVLHAKTEMRGILPSVPRRVLPDGDHGLHARGPRRTTTHGVDLLRTAGVAPPLCPPPAEPAPRCRLRGRVTVKACPLIAAIRATDVEDLLLVAEAASPPPPPTLLFRASVTGRGAAPLCLGVTSAAPLRSRVHDAGRGGGRPPTRPIGVTNTPPGRGGKEEKLGKAGALPEAE